MPAYKPNFVPDANPFFQKATRALSSPRFDSYAAKGGGDIQALQRYLWNTSLCEALYPTFQILEVCFRNAVHTEIGTFAGTEWLKAGAPFLAAPERDSIAAAQRRIAQRRADIGNPVSHPPLKNRIGSTPDDTGASPGCLQCFGVAVICELVGQGCQSG